MRGQDAPVAAERRREDEVGEPDETRIVLDERGLGLLHPGSRAVAAGELPRSLRVVDRHVIGAF
ncbi:hypothetical protein Sfulv_04790 [Streptomyces fulvorobeus]|uniref:Uncharacterized protein n=1 Tax=Streptomyces fulvorobeus TaxID=284028 RepID=A0A7J0BZR8_9ACTN|nr:hypothetical protein [Streptomyces fulvorobeus]GFM95668.1 hypothetical protein Sfulv_04790 [Streptomyces fulvorobeus]